MDESTMKIHMKKGMVHLIRALILAGIHIIVTGVLGLMSVVGGLIGAALSTAIVYGGLIYCWRDIEKGWDKGAMAGALYGIVFFGLSLVWGFVPFGSTPIFGGIAGLFNLGLGVGWGLQMILMQIFMIIGVAGFGAVFGYVKDMLQGVDVPKPPINF
jgi:hypothetical protein